MTQEQLRMQMLAGIITEGQYKTMLNESKFEIIGSDADELLDAISFINGGKEKSPFRDVARLKPLDTTIHLEVELVPSGKVGEKLPNDSEYIQQINEDINPAKSSQYGLGKIDYQDEVSKWIKKYAVKGGMTVYGHVPSICEYLNHDEELLGIIGIEFDKKGKLKTIKKPNRIYTIVNSILRPNGELRLRSDIQKPPYWKFVKAHYFGLKPFHMNQGVAASNYKHWMRPAVSKYNGKLTIGMSYDDYFALKEARTKVDKMTQQIWYALRKMIVEDGLR